MPGCQIEERRDDLDFLCAEKHWAAVAERLVSWAQPWSRALSPSTAMEDVRWFTEGQLNVAANCLDRHLDNGRGTTAAIIWQGDQDQDVRVYTYQMLHAEVCRFANVLKKYGVQPGDRVAMYLPVVPELVVAMLACARIGAVHCVVFAGFSSTSLQQRLVDCGARILVTADVMIRGGRILPIKANVDEALENVPDIAACFVVKRFHDEVAMRRGRDFWYHRAIADPDISLECPPESMAADAPLFLLYTSGSTARPKGVVHSCGGYFTYALFSAEQVFKLSPLDTIWCTADIGWITGHTYGVYAPLGFGCTTLLFEGIPSYPGPDRYWQVVEKYRVSVFYTAPTVIRVLMRYGNEPADIHDLCSLRVLATVGEPLSADAWNWYHWVIGKGRIGVIDTWWQTETGGIMVATTSATASQGPGAGSPLPGVEMAIVNEDGLKVSAGEQGSLVITTPWPGMLSGLFDSADGEASGYFSRYPGCYATGDAARYDAEGNITVTGRIDDVIKIGGCRIGTAQVESVLLSHGAVAEAAVVAIPHTIKGQAICAYVTVQESVATTPELLEELRQLIATRIGKMALPESIQYARCLPKTRSGKIMRRVLRKIATDDNGDFGDTSALADPSVISELIKAKRLNGRITK